MDRDPLATTIPIRATAPHIENGGRLDETVAHFLSRIPHGPQACDDTPIVDMNVNRNSEVPRPAAVVNSDSNVFARQDFQFSEGSSLATGEQKSMRGVAFAFWTGHTNGLPDQTASNRLVSFVPQEVTLKPLKADDNLEILEPFLTTAGEKEAFEEAIRIESIFAVNEAAADALPLRMITGGSSANSTQDDMGVAPNLTPDSEQEAFEAAIRAVSDTALDQAVGDALGTLTTSPASVNDWVRNNIDKWLFSRATSTNNGCVYT